MTGVQTCALPICREAESGGSCRQNAGLTNRKRIEAAQRGEQANRGKAPFSEKRGHRFCRYADDCNIHVGSQRSGERVMTAITAFLEQRLKLKVNAAKSAVARPFSGSFWATA